MWKQNNRGSRNIESVDKTCQIISELGESNGLMIKELTERVEISKGTVHAHLTSLREHGLVKKEHNKYYLTLRFMHIGERLRNQYEIYNIGNKEVIDLAERTKGRAQMFVEDAGLGVILALNRSDQAVVSPSKVGEADYLHCTAAGKAILAEMPDEDIMQVINSRGLVEKTNNTITCQEDLFDEVKSIRETGIAYNVEENVKGLVAVGASVSNRDGHTYGGISVSVAASRSSGDIMNDSITNEVKKSTNRIELEIMIG